MYHFKIVYANLDKNPNHKPVRMKNINEYPQHRHDKLILTRLEDISVLRISSSLSSNYIESFVSSNNLSSCACNSSRFGK